MAEAERIAIGRRPRDLAMRDAARGGAVIFYDNRLTKRHPHVLGNDASDGIRRPARCGAHDDRDRPRRIGLRPREPRYGWERECTRCQMQESTAQKCHDVPPWRQPNYPSARSSDRAAMAASGPTLPSPASAQHGSYRRISCQFEEVAIAWGLSLRASIGSDFPT